jgi:hypothetical protein
VDAGAPGELPLREDQRLLPLLDREAKPRADVRAGPFDHCGQARACNRSPSFALVSDVRSQAFCFFVFRTTDKVF